MFREIRTSERITERDREEARKNRMLMEIFDKRITEETINELKTFEKTEAVAAFDPDKRIVVG